MTSSARLAAVRARPRGIRPATPAPRPDRALRAIADGTRLRILGLLLDGEICVGDLVAILRVPQPTASRHLACLRAAGLVATRRHRLWTFYALARPTSVFHARLLDCVRACLPEVPQLRADVLRATRVRASGGCCPEGLRAGGGKGR
jgi:ArsR family transcriptional regulator